MHPRQILARAGKTKDAGEIVLYGDIGPAEAIDLVFSWDTEREQFAAQGRRKCERMRSDEGGLWLKTHQGDIDPVHTCARKCTDVELGGWRRAGS